MQFKFIDNEEDLINESKYWSEPIIAVDLECENNLHHYGSRISLIQLSTKDKNWIVDVITLENIKPILDLFKNPDITKVFHDANFDLWMVYKQFKCRVKNIFDTQIAALLLGKEELGLGFLLNSYFKVEKVQKFQKADWTKRPLTTAMLEYAVKDTFYLLKLYDNLKSELGSKGRLEWAKEECKLFETKEHNYHEQTFWDVKGVKFLTDSQRAVLKKLFTVRHSLAKKVDRPVHFVISGRLLIELSKNPLSLKGWNSLRDVHPIVRKNVKIFFNAVNDAKGHKIPIPIVKKKFYTQKQKDDLHTLSNIRDVISKKLNIQKHLVLSKDQMHDIVLTKKTNSLRNWQKKLVEDLGHSQDIFN